MKIIDYYVRAPATSTDEAPMRFDGTTGDLAQSTDATLTDPNKLTLPHATTGQLIVGGTVGSFTTQGVALSPHIVSHTTAATEPNIAFYRDTTSPTGGPSHNFFRSRSAGAVSAGDFLAIISGVGHDGTDYAPAAQISIVVDSTLTDGTAVAPGNNDMPGCIRFQTSADGGQTPLVAMTIKCDKEVLLASTAVLTVPNAGLRLKDTDDSHALIVKPGSDLTADRILTVTTGDAARTLTLPLYTSFTICGNTGTVTNGTTTYLTGGSVTAGVGMLPLKAMHLTRMTVCFLTSAATTSGVVDARFTLIKNGNNPASNRVFVIDQLNVTTGTGYMVATTTVVDAGNDAIDGVDDYLVLAVQAVVATSFSLTNVVVLVEGTLDA